MTLTTCNIRNYSIYLFNDLLIAYFEYVGSDYDVDKAKIAADPSTQDWWEHTDPCQVPVPTAAPGATWADLWEVWHLD